MNILNIILAVAAVALSGYVAPKFFKAGKFKATSSKETLLGAGFGWIEKIPFGLVRVIAWLEILGAIAIVAAPVIAYLIPLYGYLQYLGIAAAVGLALTMVGAAIVHQARGESKYTLKMNATLFAWALAVAILHALVTLPVL